MYGIDESQNENLNSINNYLIEIGCDTNNNFILKPEFYLKLFKNLENKALNTLIFDESDKNYIYHPNESKCDGFFEPFLLSLDAIKDFKFND